MYFILNNLSLPLTCQGKLNASAHIVSVPEVAALSINRRVPLTELSESDARLLLNPRAALTISDLMVLSAVRGQVWHLGCRAMGVRSARNVDTHVVIKLQVSAA